MVLFEAMGAKVPIIASRVGGVPDMLDSSEAALVPAGDERALATAVREVATHREMAEATALRAWLRLRSDSDVRAWADRYEQVYRAAVASSHTR